MKKYPILLMVAIMVSILVLPIIFATEKNGRVLGPAYDSVTASNIGDKNILIVPNSNHFAYAKLHKTDLENGVELNMLTGNKLQVVGKAYVKLLDEKGMLEITIDGEGTFGAIAFNKLPEFKNGNIHSQKEVDLAKFGASHGFNHDNKTVIKCPPGDIIYLYIHCKSMRFYKETTLPPVVEPPEDEPTESELPEEPSESEPPEEPSESEPPEEPSESEPPEEPSESEPPVAGSITLVIQYLQQVTYSSIQIGPRYYELIDVKKVQLDSGDYDDDELINIIVTYIDFKHSSISPYCQFSECNMDIHNINKDNELFVQVLFNRWLQ